MKTKNIKVLLAKTSLDGHDRGVKVIARMLRDAGMEVVYLGKLLSPEQVVQTAIQEDADVVGLSFLSGEHLAHTRKVSNLFKKKKFGNVLFLVGGCIPRQDIPKLKKMGVHEVFEAGSPVEEIEKYILKNVKK